MTDITDPNAIATLFASIDELNGVDKYVPAEVPDTPLSGGKMMHIPIVQMNKLHKTLAANVGVAHPLAAYDILEIASANFEHLRAEGHQYAAEVSVLRALIAARGFVVNETDVALKDGVKLSGIYTKRAEIMIVGSTKKLTVAEQEKGVFVVTKIDASLKPLSDLLLGEGKDDLVKLASLLPTFAAIEFQKTNHHYVDDDFYRESYKRHFKSAQLLALNDKWNKASIIYDAVHWLGPMNMEWWKQNLSADPRGLLPRGIVIKARPAPAGTALCRTQIAVWKAIAVYPGGQELIDFYADYLKKMNELAAWIEEDRLAFHVYARLFNKTSRLEDKEVVDHMSACGQLAAVAQAFIETIARGTDLARARALKKHAEQNIALFKIASAVFKGTMRKVEREGTMHALIRAIRGAPEPSASGAAIEVPEETAA